jgi:hypothetical protein
VFPYDTLGHFSAERRKQLKQFSFGDRGRGELLIARIRAFASETQHPASFQDDRWFVDGKTVGQQTWPVPHLIVVLAGQGWAMDDAKVPTELREGTGILWDAGEWFSYGGTIGLEAKSAEAAFLTYEAVTGDFSMPKQFDG